MRESISIVLILAEQVKTTITETIIITTTGPITMECANFVVVIRVILAVDTSENTESIAARFMEGILVKLIHQGRKFLKLLLISSQAELITIYQMVFSLKKKE